MQALIIELTDCMQDGHQALGFEFNVEAVHARSSSDLAFALKLAEQRARAAEQALREAEAARARLEVDLAAADAAKRELWNEKRALANENELLFKRIGELVQQISHATSRDLQLELAKEISKLQRRLDDRNRSLYGSSSERRPREEKPEQDKKKAKRRRKRTGAMRTEQPKLPIREIRHELAAEQCEGGCHLCGGDLTEMVGQTEDSEEVGVERIVYELRAHRRQKYRCTCCSGIRTAPGPVKLVPGGRYSIDLAAQIAVDKYEDALPLNRQVKRMKRAGLQVTSQALFDQLELLYLLLLPTLLVLHERILQAEVCFADETPWRMMPKEGGSYRWWLWSVSDGSGVYFQLVTSRDTAAGRSLLHDFDGILMADDYSVYRALEKERTRKGGVQRVFDEDGNIVDLWTPNFTLATCLMHGRRYLYRAERYHPDEAGPALDIIGKIYDVEDQAVAEVEARRKAAGRPVNDQEARAWLLEARRRRRGEQSRSLFEQLDEWRKGVVRLEGTALAEAIDHLDRIWDRLVLCLDDPRIPLDNGHAERQIRVPVVGRKSYHGCRSELGARVAALFFSLIGTARNLGLDPHAYLVTAATRARLEQGAVYTPWDYAADVAAAEVAAAAAKAAAGPAAAAAAAEPASERAHG